MILESAEPRDVHHFATLLGYGAQAVDSYPAQECVAELVTEGLLDKDPGAAVSDYNSAILHGIVKIASKMGISTIQSYQSAQIFECVGIHRSVIDRYFTNTVSRVGAWVLQKLARAWSGTTTEYAAQVDRADKPHTLRGALDFRFDEGGGIPMDEVESEDSIVKRFKTGAMSYGSISQEAHECIASAMNHIGEKSNSGEGGEDPVRYGTDRNSAIKQVSSVRFGVTSEYLCSAEEIQIKMTQGAKPGEGGPPLRGQGLALDCQNPLLHSGRDADLSPAPPRYLLH